ncbi:GNAT family N-acetyltransferase [Endozoicomonas sp. 4G]|uniref:GNAT family N-acetyltransferase n=1 Tax=Endozoicomonas sp. 4G TaxID=2872754 RepID=UPI0020790CD0|nr:GNAT family N-acetyltransferase [Endozoicomonas sp. 4G]
MKNFEFKNNIKIDLQNISIVDRGLKLVSISDKYAKEIFCEFSEEVTRYMAPKPTENINETLDFISCSIEGMKAKQQLVLVITSLKDEFLGCVALYCRGNACSPELGVWVKKTAHGNGYGRKVVSSLFQWASNTINFKYAIYPVDRRNIASRKIPESLGGVIFKEAKVTTESGNVLDEVVYQIKA